MTMGELQNAIGALTADAAEVDRMVAGLAAEQWSTPTPAEGWTVAHQIGHLGFVFTIAGMAAGRPEAFTEVARSVSGFGQFDAAVNAALADYLRLPPAELLGRWRSERDAGVAVLAGVDENKLVPWLVHPLPPVVLVSAGMMELFAHGQDVADALGVTRTYTDRLAYLVHFAVRTRDFGYESHGVTPPADEFRFEITLPSGAELTFGPAGSEQRVTGPAVDLCLLVSRRRHADDVGVKAVGEHAERWLALAQAYRGPAGSGRAPGQFARAA
jgi:enediyne biosynthesis protein E11